LFWVSVGGFFMYLTLKDKSLNELFDSIIHANPFWVGMNCVTLIGVFFLRGYRWRLLLKNTGENPKLIYVLYSLVMGFFVNSFTPRLGEVARCTALKQADDVPVSKSLGTMVTERIWDLLILMIGIVVIFFLELGRLQPVWDELMTSIRQILEKNMFLFLGTIVVLVLAGLIVFRILKHRKVFEKGRRFIQEFWQTIRLSFKIKRYPRFLFVTLLIWITLIFMNYFSLLALRETSGYSFYFAFILLFVVGIGWAIPSPSGIGTTHFIVLQIFLAFNLPETGGVAFGVLSNGLTFIYTIILGGLSLLIYQMATRKRSKV
jgi:glycosyltransferase 2 family protein